MIGYGRKLGTKAAACLAAAWLVLVALPAWAQLPLPFITGPQDPSQLNFTVNQLISELNAILVPTFGNSIPGATSVITFTSGQPGQPVTIGATGTNTGILLNPTGSGNNNFFGQGDTGVVQIGNSTSFVPGNGVDRCPGYAGINRSVTGGPSATVRGYFLMQDWLGREYASVVC